MRGSMSAAQRRSPGGRWKSRRALSLLAVVTLMLGGATSATARAPFPDFTPFDRTAGEYPEGVAVDKTGNVYVSLPQLGQVWKIAPDGDRSVLVEFPTPGAVGLAVNAQGEVFVAGGIAGGPYAGVWKVDQAGNAEMVPGTDAIVLPNALAFDDRGNLFVTETFSLDGPLVDYDCTLAGGPILGGKFGRGGIWRVPRGGDAELWLRSDLLTGLCQFPIPYPVGANGIAYRHGALFVNSTEKALVVRIPVGSDGAPGTPHVVTQVTGADPVFGPPALDGIALDVHGNIYAAVINQSRVIKISPDGATVETVATMEDSLDFPTSLAFGTGKGERRSLFAVNSSLGPPNLAGPGLVKLHMDDPGMPLP